MDKHTPSISPVPAIVCVGDRKRTPVSSPQKKKQVASNFKEILDQMLKK